MSANVLEIHKRIVAKRQADGGAATGAEGGDNASAAVPTTAATSPAAGDGAGTEQSSVESDPAPSTTAETPAETTAPADTAPATSQESVPPTTSSTPPVQETSSIVESPTSSSEVQVVTATATSTSVATSTPSFTPETTSTPPPQTTRSSSSRSSSSSPASNARVANTSSSSSVPTTHSSTAAAALATGARATTLATSHVSSISLTGAAATASSTASNSAAKATGAVSTGAIAGGVIGGLAGLGLIAFLLLWCTKRKQRRDREFSTRRATMGGMSFVDTSRPMTVMTEKPVFTDPHAPMPPAAPFAGSMGGGNRDSVASVNIAGRGATGGGYGDYDPHAYDAEGGAHYASGDAGQYSGNAYTDDDMYNAHPMQHHDPSSYGGWQGGAAGYSDQAHAGYADVEREQGQHGYDQNAYAFTADGQQQGAYGYSDHTHQHNAGYAQ